MKKSVKLLALTLSLLLLVSLVAACGSTLSGTYGGETYTMTFSGSKVSVSWKGVLDSYTVSGTYAFGKDEEGGRTVTFDLKSNATDSALGDVAVNAVCELLNTTHPFNQGKDDGGSYIEISNIKYYKK